VWLGLYPSFGRTFLFAEPAIVLLLASGTDYLFLHRRPPAVRLVAGLAFAVLLGVATSKTIHDIRPSRMTETTRTLTYLLAHARGTDALYVSRAAQLDYRYYLECGCLANSAEVARARAHWPLRPTAGFGQFDAALRSAPPAIVAGSATGLSEAGFKSDFGPLLERRRVWLFVMDPEPTSTAAHALTALLKRHGRILEVFPSTDGPAVASLYLYSPKR
jgi:hypothetical protein